MQQIHSRLSSNTKKGIDMTTFKNCLSTVVFAILIGFGTTALSQNEPASGGCKAVSFLDTGDAIRIGRQGGFVLGGRTVTLSGFPDPTINGDYGVEGTYVHYQVPHRQQYRYPLIMVHGNVFTGVVWESTPDGRQGWQTRFLRRDASVP